MSRLKKTIGVQRNSVLVRVVRLWLKIAKRKNKADTKNHRIALVCLTIILVSVTSGRIYVDGKKDAVIVELTDALLKLDEESKRIAENQDNEICMLKRQLGTLEDIWLTCSLENEFFCSVFNSE